MVSYLKMIRGIENYIDAEVMPRLSGNWKSWVLGVMIGVVEARAAQLLDIIDSNEMLHALQLTDGEMIDAELLMGELAKHAKDPITVSLPVIGSFTFDSSDVSKLCAHVRNATR